MFNTEAHPFPRFQLGKLFTTGWQRKLRGKDGRIIGEAKPDIETRAEQPVPTDMKTVVVQDESKATQLSDSEPAGEQANLKDKSGLDPVTGKEKDSGR